MLPQCTIDHNAITKTVHQAVQQSMEQFVTPTMQQKLHETLQMQHYQQMANQMGNGKMTMNHSSVPVTMARPMWTEGYADPYREIELQPSDQFYDKGTHYELKQHYPMVDVGDIMLFEKDGHLHLSIKKDKGAIHYAVQKTIPLPMNVNKKGITSFFTNGILTIVVEK